MASSLERGDVAGQPGRKRWRRGRVSLRVLSPRTPHPHRLADRLLLTAVARFSLLVPSFEGPVRLQSPRHALFAGGGGGLALPVGLALWRQPWPGDPALAARQLEQRHRLVFPDLLYVPDTCGGEGVCAMLKNRLEHVRVSVGLAISVRSLRRGPRRPCVSGHRVGCPPVSTLVRSEHSASAALQL